MREGTQSQTIFKFLAGYHQVALTKLVDVLMRLGQWQYEAAIFDT